MAYSKTCKTEWFDIYVALYTHLRVRPILFNKNFIYLAWNSSLFFNEKFELWFNCILKNLLRGSWNLYYKKPNNFVLGLSKIYPLITTFCTIVFKVLEKCLIYFIIEA